MIFDYTRIAPLCAAFGVEITGDTKRRLDIYGSMLLEYNEKMNLTAITDPAEVVIKHFYDCLLFLKNVNVKNGAALIDVGTGAGFPGMVLKIARPDIKLTLLDGLNKRLDFLRAVLENTELDANVIHMRAEDGGRDPALRETFDIAAARAVAALPVLCELCIPYVKPGGYFVAMKGAGAADETAAAEKALRLLGCEKPVIMRETLTGNEERAFVIAKKISQTSPKYPRSFSKIKKSAL